MQRRLFMLCAVALFVLPFAFAKTGPQCTDRDLDGAAIEGGSCGPIDCNDEDNALRPGGREVCGDNVDNNCNGRADEGCRCSDTDGGKVFEVRGEACRTSTFGRRTCTVDRCLDDDQVEEFFCKRASKGSFRVQSEIHTCEGGCNNGACVTGDVTFECVTDNDCENDQLLCRDGECHETRTLNIDDPDTNCGTFGDFNTDGTRNCADVDCLRKRLTALAPSQTCVGRLPCANMNGDSVVDMVDFRLLVQAVGDAGLSCEGSAPIPIDPNGVAPTPCTDTDGGHNYAVRGTATRTETLVQGQSGFQDMTDFCVRENTGSANPRLLAEAFCTLEGFVFRENFLCPGQCVSGACIAATGGIDVG